MRQRNNGVSRAQARDIKVSTNSDQALYPSLRDKTERKTKLLMKPGNRSSRRAAKVGSMVFAGALVAGCGTQAQSASSTQGKGSPYVTHFSYGTFHLASSVAAKIKSHQPITIDISYQGLSIPGAPQLLKAGMLEAATWVKSHYGRQINVNLVGPPQDDTPQQISQVQSLTSAGQVDCLGIEPVDPGAFQGVINNVMTQGVPVFTVNTDSPNSHRIAYIGADDTNPSSPDWTGRIAGNFTVNWAKQNHVHLTSAVLTTGEPGAAWAVGRMQGWAEAVNAAFPGIKMMNTPTTALGIGFTAGPATNAIEAYMNGNPGVQMYYNTDFGAGYIANIIGQRGLKGKVYTVGFNMNAIIMKALQNGTMVGTIDQRFDLQGAGLVKACAAFLFKGQKPASQYEYVRPSVWTPQNVAAAEKVYNTIPGSLGQ